jgi:hypothetical protein
VLIPVLRICVMFFRCVLFPADLTQAEFYGILLNFIQFYEFYGLPDSLLWTTKQLTCVLADKCNKDQLKKYLPEDGLIKEAETCRGELIKVVA